ncbi:zinc finger CCCH domain-containing protein 56-like isoform X1 [Salvia hispanica]|uniref:zinc finger CCCH domain-containing protein 56-like isoform X1 n=1 Tax=Salvia hispanica TaxID=49212 RepID=UPI0020090325|nr:zinc finger CCCH domain-containing protein 56-like isoform X1 [Salvia hispanica]
MNRDGDSQISGPVNFGGKIAYDHRPQPRNPNHHQQPFSDHGFKRPRPRTPLTVNRSKLSIPYKSEMCNLFQMGKCYYGENCHFAHNLREIRGLEQGVAMAEPFSERRRFFSGGRYHPYQSVGRDEGGLNRVSGRGGGDSIECRSLSGGCHYYKTKLCARWLERFGSCPYGEKCTYAHGKEELQLPGYYAELVRGRDSRSMPDSLPTFAGSCKMGIETAKEEGGVNIMKWDIEKISEVYADWVGVGHDTISMSH